MPVTPSKSKAAHEAIGHYREAVASAKRHALALAEATANARAAALVLQPYVTSTLPVIEWSGGPPIAEWDAAVEGLIAETKAGLAAA